MDIKQIVNNKGKVAAAAHASVQDPLHLLQLQHANSMSLSETGSERGVSPHDSERSHYSTPRYNPMNSMNGGPPHDMRYPSPTAMQNSMGMMPQQQFNGYMTGMQQENMPPQQRPPTEQVKAFPCSTCGKGFARRSDLARHERIHSGHRPHVCDFPGCGKQFIQRSALTVHTRVHTGEKPHMCERCSKPFSDSSSLARHRRIHSGKRPYKCPYADCQKTFTRRTTLTRHQNHHTGTVEEAAAATAAVLASRGGGSRAGRRSDGEQFSNTGSPISTPSPNHRHMTASPNSELGPPMGVMPRDQNPYAMSNSSLPNHLRNDYYAPSQTPPTNAPYSNNIRPTSHPTGYSQPPSVLEPPANMDRQSGSQTSSPHLSHVGWQSPSSSAMPSPPPANFAYPDPDPYGGQLGMAQHMYYQNSNMRRPQSSEPEQYDMKGRMNNEMWATAQ